MLLSKRSLLNRFMICIVAFILLIGYIFFTMGKIAFYQGGEWRALQHTLQRDSIPTPAMRGNILSDDNRILSATMPSYILEIDWKADGIDRNALHENIDSLSLMLSRKPGGKSPAEYKKFLLRLYAGGISPKRRVEKLSRISVSYSDLKEIKRYPFFRLGRAKTGLRTEERVRRDRPFGMLAARTIGDVYESRDKGGKNGLELAYDSLLSGIPGLETKCKKGNSWVSLSQVKPIDGCDVHTTINIEIQDMAEQALLDKLKTLDAESGTLILMETHSGEIKAMANLVRTSAGVYKESRNIAVSAEIEPGSTFKTASLMVALESRKVKLSDSIYCEKGIWKVKEINRSIKDANWYHGGYQNLSIEQVIWNSSNIGTAKMIQKVFRGEPEKFVDALYKIGLNRPIDIGIPGIGKPVIKHPKENRNIWWGTSMLWMSFGYELKIPPIYTLMFYNAIANNGKMISPILVRNIEKNGRKVKTFHSEVINPQICSSTTLEQVQQTLKGVVTDGTAKAVHSEVIAIAGKTGTAQIDLGRGGHNVSFCGYFPADDPKYTGIVVISKPRNGYPSGGTMSGAVLRTLAEGIVSSENIITQSPTQQLDQGTILKYPEVKGRYSDKANRVLRYLYSGYKPKTSPTEHFANMQSKREETGR